MKIEKIAEIQWNSRIWIKNAETCKIKTRWETSEIFIFRSFHENPLESWDDLLRVLYMLNKKFPIHSINSTLHFTSETRNSFAAVIKFPRRRKESQQTLLLNSNYFKQQLHSQKTQESYSAPKWLVTCEVISYCT